MIAAALVIAAARFFAVTPGRIDRAQNRVVPVALGITPAAQDLQATLDVEFMAQTLSNYTTEKAGDVQSQIYLVLDERTDNEARSKLQGELPEMRAVLKKLREGTKGEFGCFRREKRGRSDRPGSSRA